MTQPDRNDSGTPFASIILVILMSVGAFWVQTVSLPSARPPESPVAPGRYTAQQSIDARLWQDPFEALGKATPKFGTDNEIAEFAKQLLNRKTSSPAPGDRGQQAICQLTHGNDSVKIMAVMVNGSPYAQAAEARRRTRYAMVSGAGTQRLSPAGS